MSPPAPPDLHLADRLPDGCAIGPPGDLPPAIRAAAFGPPEGIRMRLMLVPFEGDDLQLPADSAVRPSASATLAGLAVSVAAVAAVTWVHNRFGGWWTIAAVGSVFVAAFVVSILGYVVAARLRSRGRRRANRASPELRGHDTWFSFYRTLGHLVAATGGRVCAWCGEDLSGRASVGRCGTCQRTYDHASLAAFWGFDRTGQWVGPIRAGLLTELSGPVDGSRPADTRP